jgi:hypothetical protein
VSRAGQEIDRAQQFGDSFKADQRERTFPQLHANGLYPCLKEKYMEVSSGLVTTTGKSMLDSYAVMILKEDRDATSRLDILDFAVTSAEDLVGREVPSRWSLKLSDYLERRQLVRSRVAFMERIEILFQ